jgi:hypothetical protein
MKIINSIRKIDKKRFRAKAQFLGSGLKAVVNGKTHPRACFDFYMKSILASKGYAPKKWICVCHG